MPTLLFDRLLAESAEPGRDCGACTVCCTVLAENELKKPMRCACEHVGRNGCGIYAARPRACREFHCLWLRGVLPAEERYRPDHLGVLFDGYRPHGSQTIRLVALEAWNDAIDAPLARTLIDSIATIHALELSRRDGTWQTLEPEVQHPQAQTAGDLAVTESSGSSSGTRDSTGIAGAS